MFSNTLSLLSSRNVSDQVSHPYKTTGKITVLYCLLKLDNFLVLKSRYFPFLTSLQLLYIDTYYLFIYLYVLGRLTYSSGQSR
jgi:hypothetical protein